MPVNISYHIAILGAGCPGQTVGRHRCAGYGAYRCRKTCDDRGGGARGSMAQHVELAPHEGVLESALVDIMHLIET